MKKYYNSGEVAKILQVTKQTLFSWEKDEEIPLSSRDDNGYRVWDEDALQQIVNLKGKKNHHIIALTNQKGGVAKTSCTQNIGACLSTLYQKKVLLVDLDPQGNLSQCYGVDTEKLDPDKSITNVLLKNGDIENVIMETPYKNLYIIPSDVSLAKGDYQLSAEIGGFNILNIQLGKIIKNYDFVLIDSPPNLGALTLSAIIASDTTIVPVECEFFSLKGLTLLLKVFNDIRSRLNKNINIKMLLTKLDKRTSLGKAVKSKVKSDFDEFLFDSCIRTDASVAKSQAARKPLIDAYPKSKAAIDFNKLTLEIIKS